MDLAWSNDLKLKMSWCWIYFSFCLLQMLTDGLWIIVMFLSDSHSDGTHSLKGIHYWESDGNSRNSLIFVWTIYFLYFFEVNMKCCHTQ